MKGRGIKVEPFIFLNSLLYFHISLTKEHLIRFAQAQLGSAHIASEFFTWDFIREERGKLYEVQVRTPNREIVPASEIHEHFTNGFVGNTACFIAWAIEYNPKGFHASIPELSQLLQKNINGKTELAAPYYGLSGDSRGDLSLSIDARYKWSQGWSYVAFREIHQTTS